MVMKMTVRSRTYAGLLPGFGSGLELKIKDLGSMVIGQCHGHAYHLLTLEVRPKTHWVAVLIQNHCVCKTN